MSFDPWRQWQSYAAAFTAPGSTPPPGFAPFIDAAERFTTAARSFFDGAARDPSKAAAAAAGFGDFLREQFASLQMPWSAAAGGGAAVATPASPFDAPALGATREHQQRLQRVADAWRRIEDAQRRLQRMWADSLREASTAFTANLAKVQGATNTEGLRKLYDAWIDCAEDAYARTAHTEAFCAALADHVNASADWRRELQSSMEQWAKLSDLPTRSELNTLAQRLKAVEQRLRVAPSPAVKPRATNNSRSCSTVQASTFIPSRYSRCS